MTVVSTRRHLALLALQAFDVLIFVAVAVFTVLTGPAARDTGTVHVSWNLFAWLVASALAWHLCLARARLYRSHRLAGGFNTLEIATGVTIGAMAIGALALLLRPHGIHLISIFDTWWRSAAMMVLSRALLSGFLGWLRRRGHNLRFALIVGHGERAINLTRRLYEPSTGYRVIGFIDADEREHVTRRPGQKYLGTISALPRILATNVVDEVFVVLPVRSSYDHIAETIRRCEEQGVTVRIAYDVFKPDRSLQTVELVDGLPILSIESSAVPLSYLATKRGLDVVLALASLIVLAPLLLVVAIAVKLDSPGPVLFVQKRVGMNKRIFSAFKFRTMRVDSEARQPELEHLNEAGGAAFKIRDDPRVTRVGAVLRRWSLDELPQLVNVLAGEMSMVGPRPLPLRDVERFDRDWQRRRFSVRPGITCLWQISGRSSIGFDKWMELDMRYIDTRNLALDLKILIRTIPAVLRGTGAY